MMTEKDVKQLLDKYFEGNTSCKEERQLRGFFAKKDIPENLSKYRPIFAYIDEESSRISMTIKSCKQHKLRLHYTWSAVAACIIIVLGIAGYNDLIRQDKSNYVIINGEKYTDVRMAKQQAQKAFEEVSFSKEDINDLLPNDMKENLQ